MKIGIKGWRGFEKCDKPSPIEERRRWGRSEDDDEHSIFFSEILPLFSRLRPLCPTVSPHSCVKKRVEWDKSNLYLNWRVIFIVRNYGCTLGLLFHYKKNNSLFYFVQNSNTFNYVGEVLLEEEGGGRSAAGYCCDLRMVVEWWESFEETC